jgi:hypothetical protein
MKAVVLLSRGAPPWLVVCLCWLPPEPHHCLRLAAPLLADLKKLPAVGLKLLAPLWLPLLAPLLTARMRFVLLLLLLSSTPLGKTAA